ncbi:MAG: hypothetical protein WC222_02090 [Parachlamydiales bacterium]|jgi:hypothetical protein
MEKSQEILDKLLKNAEALVDLSAHDPSETELIHLQQVQEQLLNELEALQSKLEGYDEISEKLELFVQLNRRYIENLARSWGVIQLPTKDKHDLNST